MYTCRHDGSLSGKMAKNTVFTNPGISLKNTGFTDPETVHWAILRDNSRFWMIKNTVFDTVC